MDERIRRHRQDRVDQSFLPSPPPSKESYREPAMTTTVKIQTRVILCDVDTCLLI
jgi:hypothetical protein